MQDQLWFRIQGKLIQQKRTMTDVQGMPVVGYEKKSSFTRTAYFTIEQDGK